jgi:hypothetical protein
MLKQAVMISHQTTGHSAFHYRNAYIWRCFVLYPPRFKYDTCRYGHTYLGLTQHIPLKTGVKVKTGLKQLQGGQLLQSI